MGLSVPHPTSPVSHPALCMAITPLLIQAKPGHPEQSRAGGEQGLTKPGMVRIDYAKLQPEFPLENIHGGSVTKPSLNSTIERLKGKLGHGEMDQERNAFTQPQSDLGELKVEGSGEGDVSAEEVLHLLLGVGITPFQPISILDRSVTR